MTGLSSWFARKLFGVDAHKTLGVDSQADGLNVAAGGLRAIQMATATIRRRDGEVQITVATRGLEGREFAAFMGQVQAVAGAVSSGDGPTLQPVDLLSPEDLESALDESARRAETALNTAFTTPADNGVDFGDARPGEFATAEGLTLEQEEWVEGANTAVERHAREILSLALRLLSADVTDDLDAAVARATTVWLSLLVDPAVVQHAAQLPSETAAARLLRQHLGDRLP